MQPFPLQIHDSFTTALPADPLKHNTRRQVHDACYSPAIPRSPSRPTLIHVSDMQGALGMTSEYVSSQAFLDTFSGARVIEGTQPYAMCYGGHQFGSWAGQLGDGRAINLTEVLVDDQRWALQLKGAGETPYSRSADGLAVLRSSIREHLCSEAMHYLRVPTTRSLSLILTGDEVYRDIMYDGNGAYEPGAVVCRVAPSFIRFGNFQIHASRAELTTLKKLADYVIEHFYPEVDAGGESPYADLFRQVCERTLDMVLDWQRVGFVHGVMNTDNMSILGLTIDYGPYGWLEGYEPGWTPNTTDRQSRRYRYGYQPSIALWNLHQLANALYTLENKAEPFEESLGWYQRSYPLRYQAMMLGKVGLSALKENTALLPSLEKNLQMVETDMTLFFRELAKVNKQDSAAEAVQKISPAMYVSMEASHSSTWEQWMEGYLMRLKQETEDDQARSLAMNKTNPKYVLRNYMAAQAIEAAEKGDYSLVEELHNLLRHPYAEQPEQEKWYAKRPDWARHKVGCSMLSCSS